MTEKSVLTLTYEAVQRLETKLDVMATRVSQLEVRLEARAERSKTLENQIKELETHNAQREEQLKIQMDELSNNVRNIEDWKLKMGVWMTVLVFVLTSAMNLAGHFFT